MNIKNLLRNPLFWLSLVAAFLYSSWPWGYVFDPVVERHSLASQLEAPHHPYSWLFVAMDVLTGLVLMVVAVWQLRKHTPSKNSHTIIVSYLCFGVLVMVAALTPLVCDPTAQSCGPLIHNYRILVHGIASIASVIFLLAALFGVTVNAFREHGTHWVSLVLGFLLAGWLVFGIGSVGGMVLHISAGNAMQDYFITLCSLSIVAVVLRIEFQQLT